MPLFTKKFLLSASALTVLAFGVSQPLRADTADLSDNAAPNGYLIIPAPPAPKTEALRRDQQIFNETRKWKGSPRWELATIDDDFSLPAVITDFSCALGLRLDLTKTPKLNKLMNDVIAIEQPRTDAVKERWARVRPYVGHDEAPLCIKDRATKDHNRSYPSGHTVRGNIVAFVLSVIMPERAEEILARGRIYGESRIVCGAHWSTDVVAGYSLAAGLAPAILSRPEIQAQIPAVREELLALKQRLNAPEQRICELEKTGNAVDPFRIP